jgi:hypothetical protein
LSQLRAGQPTIMAADSTEAKVCRRLIFYFLVLNFNLNAFYVLQKELKQTSSASAMSAEGKERNGALESSKFVEVYNAENNGSVFRKSPKIEPTPSEIPKIRYGWISLSLLVIDSLNF